jgi:hypothetical protein
MYDCSMIYDMSSVEMIIVLKFISIIYIYISVLVIIIQNNFTLKDGAYFFTCLHFNLTIES